jgi:hypothetical protein
LRDYFEIVSNSFEHFKVSHWQSLRSRLIHTIDEQLLNDRVAVGEMLFEPSSPLCGILNHLTSRFGGNVHDRNVVNITAHRDAYNSDGHAAKNVADVEDYSYFYSASEPNQSICFDFKTLRIKPTHYTIRTHGAEWPSSEELGDWAQRMGRRGRKLIVMKTTMTLTMCLQ